MYSKPGFSPTWKQSKEYAESKGGRLLTSKELQEFVKTIHRGNSLLKEGAWTATTSENVPGSLAAAFSKVKAGDAGQKDWVYIGDKKQAQPGTSHLTI